MWAVKFICSAVFAALFFLAGAVHAAETLTWEDLAPAWDDSSNPVNQLPDELRVDLYTLVYARSFNDPSAIRTEEEELAYNRLKAAGKDPDAILDTIRKLAEEADRSEKTLIQELDTKEIRLPGYVLPVEFDGSSVRTFMLVPYVGACIHVPPPPPNQIVYVETAEPFETDGLYAPVWVTGKMSVGMGTKSLTLVDGSSGVDFGYTLAATRIEPYEE